MCILCGRSTESSLNSILLCWEALLSTVAESPWFSVWKSASLLDLSGSRMELSGEIGPGEHRLIYSWLDLSTRWAEGIEATQGSHPYNISLCTLKDRPNAAQPGQCFLSFISRPPAPRLRLSHAAVIFFLTQLPVQWFPVECMALFELWLGFIGFVLLWTGKDIWDSSRANLIQDSWSLHQSTCQVNCAQCSLHLQGYGVAASRDKVQHSMIRKYYNGFIYFDLRQK